MTRRPRPPHPVRAVGDGPAFDRSRTADVPRHLDVPSPPVRAKDLDGWWGEPYDLPETYVEPARSALPAVFDLRGRAALVLDGDDRLGSELVCALAEAGAAVACVGSGAARTAALAARQGRHVVALDLDRGHPARALAVADAVLGGLDVLITSTEQGSGLEALRWSVAGARRLGARGGGKVVFVGSPPSGRAAARHEVIVATRRLALRYAATGVQVNAVLSGPLWNPTAVRTSADRARLARLAASVPMGRLGGPAELGGVVLLLASSASDYVTGQVLSIDGGQSVARWWTSRVDGERSRRRERERER
jgi:2-dehydro-3-deoxy-D-gluconate 5-dehydrogenase